MVEIYDASEPVKIESVFKKDVYETMSDIVSRNGITVRRDTLAHTLLEMAKEIHELRQELNELKHPGREA